MSARIYGIIGALVMAAVICFSTTTAAGPNDTQAAQDTDAAAAARELQGLTMPRAEVIQEMLDAPAGSQRRQDLATAICKGVRGPSTVARWTAAGELICRKPSRPKVSL